jgi:hypothetical protein
VLRMLVELKGFEPLTFCPESNGPSDRPGGLLRAQNVGGAKGIRTLDLLNAIQTLFQLSYSPIRSAEYNKATSGFRLSSLSRDDEEAVFVDLTPIENPGTPERRRQDACA